MPRIEFLTPEGETFAFDGNPGASVMEIAVQEGVPGIVAECGGAAACATCHVYVNSAFIEKVGPPSDLEDDMLDSAVAERRATSRLSCQIEFGDDLDGLCIEIAPEQT